MKKIYGFVLFIVFYASVTSAALAQNDHYPQYMEMGNKAYNDQKYDLAMEYYNSAIDDNIDCWQAYVGLGNCFYYQKKYKDSLKNYEKALKMNPGNSELVKFVNFLRGKVGVLAAPTPTPTVIPQALPAGLPPLPLPGGVNSAPQ